MNVYRNYILTISFQFFAALLCRSLPLLAPLHVESTPPPLARATTRRSKLDALWGNLLLTTCEKLHSVIMV
jgi:hypothetical protein